MSSPTNTNIKDKQHRTQKRDNKTFGEAVVTKQDVGEFTSGYFIMPSPSSPSPPRSQDRKVVKPMSTSPTRPSRSRQPSPSSTVLQPTSTSKNDKSKPIKKVAFTTGSEKENYMCDVSLLTPTSIKKSTPHSTTVPLASTNILFAEDSCGKKSVSSSPPTLPSTRWAGGAFTNAPPPSALPMPSFDDAAPPMSKTSSAWETLLQAVPHAALYTPVPASAHYGGSYPSTHTPTIHSQPSTMSLTEDLRRLLNIPSSLAPSHPPALLARA